MTSVGRTGSQPSTFDGLVAVVTGGASGIGAATAAMLAEQGAHVAVLDRDVQSVDSASFLAVACDVTSTAAVDAAIADVASTLGGIDILINNAGIGAVGAVDVSTDAEWHQVLDVNVVGLARVTRAAVPHLRRSDRAAIVNICSVVAAVGVPQRAVYSASKGAVAALTLAMAADYVADGIRVNAVTPGTLTPLGSAGFSRRLRIRTRPKWRCVPANRWGVWSRPRRSATLSSTWPAPCLPPLPEPCWPSTVVCRACGFHRLLLVPRALI